MLGRMADPGDPIRALGFEPHRQAGRDCGTKSAEAPAWAAERGPFAGKDGQLDVPYWQTPPEIVERMLDLAQVGAADRLFDLGCGDGRILVAAARRGASAVGIDLDPERLAEARAAADSAGVGDRVRLQQGDFFAADLGEATIVTLFLLPHVNRWIAHKLEAELPPGARVVSYCFDIDGWEASAVERIDGKNIHLWLR